MGRAPHMCRCPECGTSHVRAKSPLLGFCETCLEPLPAGSRAKYCGNECRVSARLSAARTPRQAPRPLPPGPLDRLR